MCTAVFMDSWEVTPKQVQSAKVGLMSIHILASVFWLCKCDSKVALLSPDEVCAWLDVQTWRGGYERPDLSTVQGKLEA